MCGIVGYVSKRQSPEHGEVITRMIETMRHRGPDHTAQIQPASGVCIGYCRLSINDGKSGFQPFTSEDGTVSCVMNGEIYNWREIRQELQRRGHRFETSCDVEVIPHLYEECGVNFVDKLDGMFAICILDSNNKRLVLARDRIGIKPLYYSFSEKRFLFASEMAPLLASNLIDRKVDWQSVSEFFTFRCVPHTNTILTNVNRVAPGSQLIFDYDDYDKWQISQRTYWQPNLLQPILEKEAQAVEELQSVLKNAVKARVQVEDGIEIGVPLSGGIDSSTVTVLARLNLPDKPLHTFSVHVKDDPEDLSAIDDVVQQVGAIPHMVDCATEDVAMLPFIVRQIGEPLSAGMTIPSYQCFQSAQKQGLRVLLSGDGSDELFAGYSGRLIMDGIIQKWDTLNPQQQQQYLAERPLLAEKLNSPLRSSKLTPLERYALWDDDNTFDRELKSALFSPQLGAIPDPLERLREFDAISTGARHENRMFFLETKIRLDGFMLVILDRMSMACSVESRTPFLDKQVVDFAFRLAPELKYSNGIEKYVLRRTMAEEKLLPESVIWRKKHPFAGPISVWMKILPPNLEKLLSPSVIRRQGFLSEQTVSHFLDLYKHTNLSRRDQIRYSDLLFAALVFTTWVELFIHNRSIEDIAAGEVG